jgi:predicted glycosyltransferase
VRAVRTRRRVAFYSHDTQGLGHIRRNIELAAAVAGDADILLFSGAPEATVLPLPPATEVITLPTIGKDSDGGYSAKVLDLPLPEVIDLRGRLIASALTAFAPDLLVVDKVARGVGGELDRALDRIRRRKIRGRLDGRTRLVLGLRDVLDSPVVTRREWRAQQTSAVIDRRYDGVWVYGDPAVYDAVAEYRLPGRVAAKLTYTGYLSAGRGESVQSSPASAPTLQTPFGPYVLCMVGGGQDGAALAREFSATELPAGHRGLLVTGPYLPPELRTELQRRAERRGDLTVLEFVTDAVDLVAGASAVVSMGGYNTVCEVLASGRPGLVVPRVTPRTEQAIRADRLAGLGLLDTIRPDALTARRLANWLAVAVCRPPGRTGDVIDLEGLRRIPFLVDGLLTGRVGQSRRTGGASQAAPATGIAPVIRREVCNVAV